jgi:hypothetical protein
MLIINSDHLQRAGVASLDQQCPYCGEPLRSYPLIMSDDPGQTVYHAACALQLTTEILVDLFTFFSPPAPSACLFTLIHPSSIPSREGGSHAINRS